VEVAASPYRIHNERRVIFVITAPSAVSIRGASLQRAARATQEKAPGRRRNAPESPRNERPRWIQLAMDRGKLPDSDKPFLIPRQMSAPT